MEKKVVTSVCEWGFRRTGQMGSSMYYGEGEMMENGWTDELREKDKQIAALEAERDRLLLSPSDPKSGWQGINKEVKVWQEKVEHITTLLNDDERARMGMLPEHTQCSEKMEGINEYRDMLKAALEGGE